MRCTHPYNSISGYESAWLADLVAAYILEESKELFDKFTYYGIYRDDGFIILKGIKTKREMNKWLVSFQTKVNKLAESDYLQFIAEVWNIDEDEAITNDKLTIVKKVIFPTLT